MQRRSSCGAPLAPAAATPGTLCPDVVHSIQEGPGQSWRGSRRERAWLRPGQAEEGREGNKKLRGELRAAYNYSWASLRMELNSSWFVFLLDERSYR